MAKTNKKFPSTAHLKHLEQRIIDAGMTDAVKERSERLAYYQEKYLDVVKEYEDTSTWLKTVEGRFFPLQSVVKELLRENFIYFAKWASDPERVEEVHEVCHEFLAKGFDALPSHYKDAAEGDQGGFFKHSENSIIDLIELTRGVGKTTTSHCLLALWYSTKYPTYKWMIVHSNKEKAMSNIRSIQGFILNPHLTLVFPELFTETVDEFRERFGNVMTKEKINFISFNMETEEYIDGKVNLNFRKEATFTVGAPGVDRTGWHFEGIFADDLVTKDTSKDEKATRELISYFSRIGALQEYHTDWRFHIWITGTEWYENSLYTHLQTKNERCNVFRMPARWDDAEGKTHYLSKYFDEEFLHGMKSLLEEWYESQMFMRPRKYDHLEFDLGFSKELNVEVWKQHRLDELRTHAMVTQVCDPSVSTKDKVDGDDRSRLTILNALVTEDMFYIYRLYQSLGKDFGFIKDINEEICLREGTEFFIQDAQGIQLGLHTEFMRIIKNSLPHIQDFPHTKPKGSATGKIRIANHVLHQRFIAGEVVVIYIDGDEEQNKEMDLVVRQLMGINPGKDIIDTVVYLVADIDRDEAVPLARCFKIDNNRATIKRFRKRPNSTFLKFA